MNKSINIKMIMSAFMIILMIGTFCSPSSQAISDIISSGREFISAGNDIESTINTTVLSNTSSTIYNVLFGIAIIVAIIVAMILGIQFMIASVDEKAKVKEALMPFIAGCIVVFASFSIWSAIIKIGNKTETDYKVYQTWAYNLSDEELKSRYLTLEPKLISLVTNSTIDEAVNKLSNEDKSLYVAARQRAIIDMFDPIYPGVLCSARTYEEFLNWARNLSDEELKSRYLIIEPDIMNALSSLKYTDARDAAKSLADKERAIYTAADERGKLGTLPIFGDGLGWID